MDDVLKLSLIISAYANTGVYSSLVLCVWTQLTAKQTQSSTYVSLKGPWAAARAAEPFCITSAYVRQSGS